MILSAGLTPAWQQIMRFERLQIGEVNRAAEVHWCGSGKVLNVGTALATLGADSHTLAPIGGRVAAAIRAQFDALQIPATWITTEAPTRICTTLLQDDAPTTELVENARPISDAERGEFIDQYERMATDASVVVLTGSLPKETPTPFYRDLLARTKCPAILDARGSELLQALEFKPRVVKPNRQELAHTFEPALRHDVNVVDAMRELIRRGAQSVVVTAGKSAVLVMEGSQTWKLTPPEVSPIINPIGCGDCLAAGIAIGLARGDTLVDAVRLGMAAAADNVTQLLPARLSLDRVEGLCKKIVSA